jgi:hypothetical protein
MIPAQLRGATGEISIPDTARDGDYDLICIGSPTWWMKTSVPIRSYLKSDGPDPRRHTVCRVRGVPPILGDQPAGS